MIQDGAEKALQALQPSTKAARIRALMPIIEAKIASGVRVPEILAVLQANGIELSLSSFRQYLHRFRKEAVKPMASMPGGEESGVVARDDSAAGLPDPAAATQSDKSSPAADAARRPVSPAELQRLMHPDPAQQAQELAQYERRAKQLKRKNRP